MTSRVARFQKQVRRQGLWSAARTDIDDVIVRSVDIIFRRQSRPSLARIGEAVRRQVIDPGTLLRLVVEQEISQLGNTTAISPSRVPSRGPAHYPPSFGMEPNHLLVLQGIIRALRPTQVIETGVADGKSTRVILMALNELEHGRLTSIDVSDDVGSDIEPGLRDRWELVVLPKSHRRAHLEQVVRSRSPVDMFIHDSDHAYRWQAIEYKLALSVLRPGGVLLSDDVDASFAFIDFVRYARLEAFTLVGTTKVMGAVVKPMGGPWPASPLQTPRMA